jgi:hypothetical protein
MARSCWRALDAERAHPAFANLFVKTEFHNGAAPSRLRDGRAPQEALAGVFT